MEYVEQVLGHMLVLVGFQVGVEGVEVILENVGVLRPTLRILEARFRPLRCGHGCVPLAEWRKSGSPTQGPPMILR